MNVVDKFFDALKPGHAIEQDPLLLECAPVRWVVKNNAVKFGLDIAENLGQAPDFALDEITIAADSKLSESIIDSEESSTVTSIQKAAGWAVDRAEEAADKAEREAQARQNVSAYADQEAA